MSSHQVKIEREEEEKITYWVPLPILREGEGPVERMGQEVGHQNKGQQTKGQDRQIKIDIQQQGFRSKQHGEDIFPRKRKSDFHH